MRNDQRPRGALFWNAARYLKRHPEELFRAARNAVGLRFGVPVCAIESLLSEKAGERGPKDIQIQAEPPGLRLAATVKLMGTEIRAQGVVMVGDIDIAEEHIKLELTIRDLSLVVLDENSDSPLAALLNSGALDLSRPGNLVAYMPKRPPMLVDAKDDRIVLDLLKHPKLAKNGVARRIVGLLRPIFTVDSVVSQERHLDVLFKAFPDGLAGAMAGVRRAL